MLRRLTLAAFTASVIVLVSLSFAAADTHTMEFRTINAIVDETYCLLQTSAGDASVNNPPYFGSIPFGPFLESATAETEVGLQGTFNTSVAIPLPQYQDGAVAEPSDVIIFVSLAMFRKHWDVPGVNQHVWVTYQDGSGFLDFQVQENEWETNLTVTTVAFRPEESVPTVRSSISKVKSKY